MISKLSSDTRLDTQRVGRVGSRIVAVQIRCAEGDEAEAGMREPGIGTEQLEEETRNVKSGSDLQSDGESHVD